MRAGVHKTTVYRRWGDEERLVAQALQTLARSRIEVPVPGDDVERDLQLLARSVAATLATAEGGGTVRAMVSAAQQSDVVHGLVTAFWAERTAQAGDIVHRAVQRGQLPAGTRPDLVIRHLGAPLYHQQPRHPRTAQYRRGRHRSRRAMASSGARTTTHERVTAAVHAHRSRTQPSWDTTGVPIANAHRGTHGADDGQSCPGPQGMSQAVRLGRLHLEPDGLAGGVFVDTPARGKHVHDGQAPPVRGVRVGCLRLWVP